MVTRDDLESFLIRMDLEFSEVDDGMYLVHTPSNGPPVVVHHGRADQVHGLRQAQYQFDRRDAPPRSPCGGCVLHVGRL